MNDERGFFSALIGDGRPLVSLTGVCLVLSGLFALFLSAAFQFLPHDVQFLGMMPDELCAINECRIVHFMFHDRVSFGGALVAIGTMYLWLVEFPLGQGEAWAWWLLLASGIVGFHSFLAYLGYGYLDTWHGVATLGLLPCFVVGMARSYTLISRGPNAREAVSHQQPRPPYTVGRVCLLLTGLGLMGGGATIFVVGTTSVFVTQDLDYMGLSASDLHAINPRLVPLIAHDRAGFGGAVCTAGVLIFFSVWYSPMNRGLWQALAVAGTFGFATAVGIHPVIGYNDAFHLAPAVAGAVVFVVGMTLTFPQSRGGRAG